MQTAATSSAGSRSPTSITSRASPASTKGYWLPTKFGYDKRRAHFSSLILTKQMTREEALEKIARPAYDEATVAQDFEYVANKLDISVDELQAICDGPNKELPGLQVKRA